MLTLPPIPTWHAIHPLIIHFPIVLLLIAPLFIVIGVTMEASAQLPVSARRVDSHGSWGQRRHLSPFPAAKRRENSLRTFRTRRRCWSEHPGTRRNHRGQFLALTLIFASIVFVPKLLQTAAEPRDIDGATVGLSVFLRDRTPSRSRTLAPGRTSRLTNWACARRCSPAVWLRVRGAE